MANRDPNQEDHDSNVEVPGDTDSADIVGPTGEQMPLQRHDSLERDDRAPDDAEDDQDSDGHPI